MAPSTMSNVSEKKKSKRKRKNLKPKKTDNIKVVVPHSNHGLGIQCPICFEDINRNAACSTKCGHVFCTPCLQTAMTKLLQCPTCRTKLHKKTGYHMLFL